MSGRKIGVLVIDDSARNRQLIRQALAKDPAFDVVGFASDGDEGLKMAHVLQPDVITLDLEMPRLDGFAFLRLLRSRAPTPVLVVSSHAHTSDVFKAMELGAYDFIGKPDVSGPSFEDDLLEKLHAVQFMREPIRPVDTLERPSAPFVIAVGASTGGPGAIQRLLEGLAADPEPCLVIAQHMPSGFTQAFAERLDRLGPYAVREAAEGDVLEAGKAFIAPGGKHLSLRQRNGQVELQVTAAEAGARHAPSVDRLFASVAEVLGSRAVGVVLTGMGNDGARGAKAIADAGGVVFAESQESSVIFGMPQEAIAIGAVKHVLPLSRIPEALLAMTGGAKTGAARSKPRRSP